MIRVGRLLWPLFALSCLALAASGPPPDAAPASTNVRGAQSPRIYPDRHAWFTLKAPEAKTVQLAGAIASAPLPMTRDAEGVWSVTTGPLVPGFHYYWFLVDGVQVNDPGSETFMGYGKETSGIEIPEAGVDFYAIKRVPHGDVREHWYFSTVTGQWRRCFVYTPPGYDTNSGTRYPVLILQHGAGEDETGW